MGENAFHMVFQERWVFSHSSPNPALAATRLWAGYSDLVGENSISPGKPCEMHIICSLFICRDKSRSFSCYNIYYDCHCWMLPPPFTLPGKVLRTILLSYGHLRYGRPVHQVKLPLKPGKLLVDQRKFQAYSTLCTEIRGSKKETC